MSKRAIILAGGKGTRLKPYTISFPKPLVPVKDKPILEIIILQLKKYGFDHISLTVNHMADIIKAYFGNGSKWGIKIDYTIESKPLSTMGPLTLVEDLPDDFLVMNGDVLTDLSFADFYDFHISKKSLFSISSYKRREKIDFGVLHSNHNMQLVSFEEKPFFDFLVSMGIYMVNKNILEFIPKDTYFGFDHLMHNLISKTLYPLLYEYNGYWLDIGRPDDYETAIEDIDKLIV